MSPEQVGQRIERLEQLSRALAKEIVVIGQADDPLLYVERRDYMTGLRAALAGIEGARVELCRARQRWRGSEQAAGGSTEPEP
jgi:hypothetical protein